MNNPDFSRKQKRLLTWQKHALESGINEETRQRFVSMMNDYQDLLAKLWKAKEVFPENLAALESLERELEELHTASRFIT